MKRRFNIIKGRFENVVESAEEKQGAAPDYPYLTFGRGVPTSFSSQYYFDLDDFRIYAKTNNGAELAGSISVPDYPDIMPAVRQEIENAINGLNIPIDNTAYILGNIDNRLSALDFATIQDVEKLLSRITLDLPKPEKPEAPKQIEMRRSGDYVQWKLDGDEQWHDLFPIPKPIKSSGGSGAAIKKLQQHEAADDPHPQYLTEIEGDARYALIGAGGAVDSVNGQTGVVVLDTGDIAEATDKNYVTDTELTLIGAALQPGDNVSELINNAGYITNLSSFDTGDLAEGSNLYYTEGRVSANTDVAANTAARHAAVTVTDSSEIDFTLTGQNITASIVSGSIDESKLDTSVNASLDLADSALQSGDNVSELINDAGYIIGNQTITLSGDVTGSGATSITTTLANSGVTAGTYGSGTQVARVTVNSKGIVTGVTNQSISFPALPVDNMVTDGSTFVTGELYEASSTAGNTARRATLAENYIYRGDGAATSRPEKVDFVPAYSRHMPRVSSLYYGLDHLDDSVIANNQAFLTGFSYFVPFAITEFFDNMTLCLNVDTAGTGNLKLGLFANGSNKPAARLGLSSDIAVTTTGLKTYAMSSLALKPGKYWALAKFSANQTGIAGSTNILATDAVFSGQSSYGHLHTVYFVIEAYATNPTDYTASTLLQATSGVGNPWIQYTGVS